MFNKTGWDVNKATASNEFPLFRYIFIDIGVVVVYTELEKSFGKHNSSRLESEHQETTNLYKTGRIR